MTAPADTIRSDATIGEARTQFFANGHGAYPVVDRAGRCVGIVRRTDLLDTDGSRDALVSEVASPDVVTVDRDATLLAAMELILEEHVDHLPVVERDGRLVGICTRTDILRSRLARQDAEPSPRGVWPRRPRRTRAGPEDG